MKVKELISILENSFIDSEAELYVHLQEFDISQNIKSVVYASNFEEAPSKFYDHKIKNILILKA